MSGTLGIVWTIWWRISYFVPASSGADVGNRETRVASETDPRWINLLRVREVWGLIIAKFLSDAAWYFYLFWLPKYLYDARGFDTKKVGTFAWIPYAAAGVGCLAGGWFSSYLVRRNFSLDMARKMALGLSAAVMPLIIFVPHVAVSWAIVIFSVAYFGQQSWSTLVMVLPADLLPRSVVGSVAGLVGFGGAMGGIAFGQLVGYLLDHGVGYSTVFTMAGVFHVVAFAVILAAIPAFEPTDVERRLRYQGAQ
jgi:ACS family hexuronate transporter-like MFS transporter